MKIKLQPMLEKDWVSVLKIYKEGMETGNATFQQEEPTYMEWDQRHLKNCRIVALCESEMVGWAALSSISGRCVYSGVAEVSVYVSVRLRGNRIGSQLLEKLIEESEQDKLWTLQAGIFPENIVSIKLHQGLGFREVGYREKIGKMNGIWRNTILMERRSNSIGI